MDRIMYKLEVGQKWVHKSSLGDGYTVYKIIDIDEEGMVHEEVVESTRSKVKVGQIVCELHTEDYFGDGEMQHISVISPLYKVLNNG